MKECIPSGSKVHALGLFFRGTWILASSIIHQVPNIIIFTESLHANVLSRKTILDTTKER
jgi:hypothetical protein